MKRMLGRLQVLPDGIIIGHIVPSEDFPEKLKAGEVYEVSINNFGPVSFEPVGEADYKMPNNPVSVDRFLVEAGGYHLTVNGGN